MERNLVFGFRCFIYCCSMTQLIYFHMRECYKSWREKSLVQVYSFIQAPKYLTDWQNTTKLCLMISQVVMLCLEPILWCWAHNTNAAGEIAMFYENCPEYEHLRFPYSLFSMFAMFLYYLLLLDLAVFSSRVSAYVLVCMRMLGEVGLFIMALLGTVLAFASGLSVLSHDQEDFAGIPPGFMALLQMPLKMISTENYVKYRQDPVVMIVVFIFLIFAVVFLMNLLIAQLTCAYQEIYEDMLGFARLNRIDIIVETMPSVSKKRWANFVASLKLDKKIEFNPGDVGVSGGVQLREAASLNPTTEDQIRRFGGSTSLSVQFPEEDEGNDESDRFDRMEKLIQKALKRITHGGGAKGKKGAVGSSQGQSGTGSGAGGSGADEKSGSGGGEDEDDE
eukprot:gnl/TRDRNA2_/TRDRNA2_178024_c1_seq6.p1 gnl/TRDRNA2_/TRDRNA2_178024_c1~~gnl/TRDRNA2_/TRDRNA2_178024_c1_seq6.p1  ORF type:complete len:392 (-),score=95.32 gnl/TRDRNA2_/TRDRNA2_178024_c1_seq6:11-1186(-)